MYIYIYNYIYIYICIHIYVHTCWILFFVILTNMRPMGLSEKAEPPNSNGSSCSSLKTASELGGYAQFLDKLTTNIPGLF